MKAFNDVSLKVMKDIKIKQEHWLGLMVYMEGEKV